MQFQRILVQLGGKESEYQYYVVKIYLLVLLKNNPSNFLNQHQTMLSATLYLSVTLCA